MFKGEVPKRLINCINRLSAPIDVIQLPFGSTTRHIVNNEHFMLATNIRCIQKQYK